MKFNEYLKSCRINYNLTQEKLVQELYSFDEDFMGVDSTTISRWEQAKTKPSIQRQISIVKYFQTLSGSVFSCFNGLDKESIENEICKLGVKNLIGNSKEHILNFPSRSFKVSEIEIKHLSSSKDLDEILQMPYTVIENLTDNVYNLSFETIKTWALHPSNLFLLSIHKNKFVGLLFSIKLKPDIFKKVIDFELDLKDVGIDDFVGVDEVGSIFPIAFFAYNDKCSTLLTLRFYAHLIANQDFIDVVGATPLLDGAKKIVKKVNMKFHKDKSVSQGTLSSYQSSLSDILINESVIKMIFHK